MKPCRLVLCLALLSGAFAASAQESLTSILTNIDRTVVPERRTSIIYIQCHGLGYGDLSCYGQTNYQTPNLDRLAAEGIRFTSFRPDSTDFTSALTSLMHGKHAAATAAPSLATLLSAAGYHTGLIGEWTVDDRPWTDGFDEFAGFLNPDEGRNYYSDFLWRHAPKSIVSEKDGTISDFSGKETVYENTGGKQGRYLPELFINMMCNFVRINQPDQFNHYKPFFLVVDLPQPRSASPVADEFPVPSDAPFTDASWPQAAKDRASLLTRLDGSIARLLAQLHDLRLSNNVAIFISSSGAPEKFKNPKLEFLSPNGTAAAGENGTPAPLPMIVWYPQEIPAGQVSNFKWTGADFLPTALQIAYVKPPKDSGGLSVLPVLQGKKGPDVDLPAPDRTFPPGSRGTTR